MVGHRAVTFTKSTNRKPGAVAKWLHWQWKNLIGRLGQVPSQGFFSNISSAFFLSRTYDINLTDLWKHSICRVRISNFASIKDLWGSWGNVRMWQTTQRTCFKAPIFTSRTPFVSPRLCLHAASMLDKTRQHKSRSLSYFYSFFFIIIVLRLHLHLHLGSLFSHFYPSSPYNITSARESESWRASRAILMGTSKLRAPQPVRAATAGAITSQGAKSWLCSILMLL